jgi:hypothetical protein
VRRSTLKKFLCIVPLCAAIVSGCEYVKSSSPTGPTSTDATGSTQQPAPAPAPIYPSNGPDIISYVVAKYPEKLAGGISLDERIDNMRFIRDRIIETGLCGGLQLGWNLKRGGPEISNDFLVWRTDHGDVGIDIGFAYDDTSQPLRLQWLESVGATFKEYPAPDCR